MSKISEKNVILELIELVGYCRSEISQLKLDSRHMQNQIIDYNTRLINLTLRVDKCINQGE